MAPRFDDFVLSTLPFLFSHFVAAFITARVSVVLFFAMFATLCLDSVFLRVCSVGLECCFWSQAWNLVSWWLVYILPLSGCFSSSLFPLV
ncbi:hypothetical protein Bca4012_009791 [Brassica carinata]